MGGKSEYVDDGDDQADDDDEGAVEGNDGSDPTGEEYIAE